MAQGVRQAEQESDGGNQKERVPVLGLIHGELGLDDLIPRGPKQRRPDQPPGDAHQNEQKAMTAAAAGLNWTLSHIPKSRTFLRVRQHDASAVSATKPPVG
jgi:hypothetical protein